MKKQVEAGIPTRWGVFNMVAYSDERNEPMPHLALVHPDVDPSKPVYLRIHSECLTGDLFGSHRCDCGPQLHQAMKMIDSAGSGLILYLQQTLIVNLHPMY